MLAAAAAPAIAAPDTDILGLRLGMTIAEAEAAIREIGSDYDVQTESYFMQYSDGVKTHRTDDYVRIMRAFSPRRDAQLMIVFSAPPTGGQVIAIERAQNRLENPPAMATDREALIDKYGTPSGEVAQGQGPGASLDLQWDLPDGNVQCAQARGGKLVNMDPSLSRSVVAAVISPDGAMLNPAAGGIGDCAALLRYTVNQDPVFAVRGRLIDIAAAAQTSSTSTPGSPS